ncbi:MAG: hypothetical protein KGK08_00540 [Acidobacteriota bacterium]|nr:hypothetical protein [Acidobacteriota bacterium]
MNCKACHNSLPDLLLDPTSTAAAAARQHLATCEPCTQEYAALRSTFDLIGEFAAPEPSAYFDQKLAVRLREEQQAAPAGWLERLRSRLLFNTGRQFRPALAGAFAFLLVVGGTTALDLAHMPAHPQVQPSAAVNDLQILDKNDQALQTMDQLLDDSGSDGGSAASPAQSSTL